MKLRSGIIALAFFTELCTVGAAQVAITSFKSISDSNFSYPSYNAKHKLIICQKRVNGFFQLFSIELSTNTTRQLTFDTCDHTHASVSKNGKWIAYRKERNNSTDIFLLSLAEGTENILTNTGKYSESHPSWSANDSIVVFNTNQYDSLQEIGSIDIHTKKTKRLSFNKEEDTYGSISPNGQLLVYSKWFDNEKNPETYIFELSSTTETRITDNPLRDVAPGWITDSMVSFTQSGGGKVNLVIYDLHQKTFKTVENPDGWLLGRSIFIDKNTIICEKIADGRAAGLAQVEISL